ncbi:MAG: ATP-binding cassette domain-containing protein, partial [Bifidobacteriaceae bacterium]|nr:ATP-binding cassette domain-containing protein [Bifidobacteriaceae bacterium]
MSLSIEELEAKVKINAEEKKDVLRGVNLSVARGEIHAIMGPNGSGKSTLAYTLAGHPNYEISNGKILLDSKDLADASPDKRAKEGLFLAFQ